MGRDLPPGIDSLLLFGPTLVAKAIDPPLFPCYLDGLLLAVGPAGYKAALPAYKRLPRERPFGNELAKSS
jgi:hypothetical protein